MKKIFENEYQISRKFLKEYVYGVLCKKVLIIGITISLIGALFSFFTTSQNKYIIITSSIIALVTSIITPIITIKELENLSRRLNNGKIEKTNIKFSNNIIMKEGKAHLEFEYNQITKIVYTKNFIVLKTSNNSAILVLKSGFLKGTKQEFIKFIEEKIIN